MSKKNNVSKEKKLQKSVMELTGKGIYIYENITNSDFLLPKLTLDNKKSVGPKQKFMGDSYFLNFVRTRMLKLVKVINNGEDQNMNENKLILDQPDMVKAGGKVEHVQVGDKNVQLNDNIDNAEKKQEQVLLTEDPVGSIQIVID